MEIFQKVLARLAMLRNKERKKFLSKSLEKFNSSKLPNNKINEKK